MKYFYISNNTVGLGMSLFKTDTHPSSFYILLSASANCEKDYYTFFPQNFYIKKKQIWFLFLKKYGCLYNKVIAIIPINSNQRFKI